MGMAGRPYCLEDPLQKCAEIVVSDATREHRQCRNAGSYNGFCHIHRKEKAAEEQSSAVKQPTVRSASSEVSRETLHARRVIMELKAYLRDPGRRGRLVAALGDYEDHISKNGSDTHSRA